MTGSLLDLPWEPLSPAEAAHLFTSFPEPWCIAGGWALDLFLGRQTRPHADIDILVPLASESRLHDTLAGWSLYMAHGVLTPWKQGEPLRPDVHDIWCRRGDGPWELQLMMAEISDTEWIYRRDQRICGPLDSLIVRNPDGLPLLAPEIQLLYKSKRPSRPKDEHDFEMVLPELGSERRAWLQGALRLVDPQHSWLDRLEPR